MKLGGHYRADHDVNIMIGAKVDAQNAHRLRDTVDAPGV